MGHFHESHHQQVCPSFYQRSFPGVRFGLLNLCRQHTCAGCVLESGGHSSKIRVESEWPSDYVLVVCCVLLKTWKLWLVRFIMWSLGYLLLVMCLSASDTLCQNCSFLVPASASSSAASFPPTPQCAEIHVTLLVWTAGSVVQSFS